MGGENRVGEKERWIGGEGRREERKEKERRMNEGKKKPSPIGDTSSNSSEKQFSLPNNLQYSNIDGSTSVFRECEQADKS